MGFTFGVPTSTPSCPEASMPPCKASLRSRLGLSKMSRPIHHRLGTKTMTQNTLEAAADTLATKGDLKGRRLKQRRKMIDATTTSSLPESEARQQQPLEASDISRFEARAERFSESGEMEKLRRRSERFEIASAPKLVKLEEAKKKQERWQRFKQDEDETDLAGMLKDCKV